MKKTLISMAIMAMAGTAVAQSSVQIYGNVDYGYGSDKWSDNSKTDDKYGIKASNAGTSFIGLKGQENLSTTTSANFVVEVVDHATTPIRKAYVALNNESLGTVKIGTQEFRSNELLSENDALDGASVAGSISSISDHTKHNPMISYQYYLDGVTWSLAYAQKGTESGEKGKTNTTEYRAREIAMNYDMNGTKFGISYLKESPKNLEANHKDTTMLIVTASKDLGYVVPNYAYMHKTGIHGINTKIGKTNEYPTDMHAKYHQLGVTIPVNNASFYANYLFGKIDGHGNFKQEHSANEAFHRNLDGYQLGAKYHFSKRTDVYALYGVNTYREFTGKEGSHADSITHKTYSIGLSHKF